MKVGSRFPALTSTAIRFEEAQKWRDRACWHLAEARRCFDVAHKIEDPDEGTIVTFPGNGNVRFQTEVPA